MKKIKRERIQIGTMMKNDQIKSTMTTKPLKIQRKETDKKKSIAVLIKLNILHHLIKDIVVIKLKRERGITISEWKNTKKRN